MSQTPTGGPPASPPASTPPGPPSTSTGMFRVCPACNARYEQKMQFCAKDGTALVTEAPASRMADLAAGMIIDDRYALVRKLGEGGMGEVWEASHVYIEKRVALKLLRPEIMSNEEAVTRFRQEARSASSIGHDNIIKVEDFGSLPDGRIYLAMEYLEGRPLDTAVEAEQLTMPALVDVMVQVCRGLSAAHSKGIVHRDMKPANVYLAHRTDGGPVREVVKILDFGIAKVSGADGQSNLTRTGTIFGTPHYMSPEQALGQNLDPRSDIYSVGVIMYEVFTGTVPFKAESFMGILTQHITSTPVRPAEAAPERQIPPALDTIILRSMAKQPQDRYQSMSELMQALADLHLHMTGLPPPSLQATPQGASVFQIPAAHPSSGFGMQSPQSAAFGIPGSPSQHQLMPHGAVPNPHHAPPSGSSSSYHPSSVHVDPRLIAESQDDLYPVKKKRGIGLWIAIAIVIGGGAAAAIVLLGSQKSNSEKPAQDGGVAIVTPPAPDAAVSLPPVVDASVPTVDAATIANAVDAGPAPFVPTKVFVTSTPSGAQVFDAQTNKQLFKTPKAYKIQTPLAVIVRAKGYEDQTITLDGTIDEVAIKLQKKAKVGTQTGTPHDPGTPPPGDHTNPKDPKDPKNPKDPPPEDPLGGLVSDPDDGTVN